MHRGKGGTEIRERHRGPPGWEEGCAAGGAHCRQRDRGTAGGGGLQGEARLGGAGRGSPAGMCRDVRGRAGSQRPSSPGVLLPGHVRAWRGTGRSRGPGSSGAGGVCPPAAAGLSPQPGAQAGSSPRVAHAGRAGAAGTPRTEGTERPEQGPPQATHISRHSQLGTRWFRRGTPEVPPSQGLRAGPPNSQATRSLRAPVPEGSPEPRRHPCPPCRASPGAWPGAPSLCWSPALPPGPWDVAIGI